MYSPWPLLMTATINPRGVPRMNLQDPNARWEQYRTALSFWLEQPGLSGIVFCENSGYAAPYEQFMAYAQRIGRPFEVLSWDDNQAGVTRGKGFGEGRLMERAFSESRLLRDADGFFKVTGRLVVTNFAWVERLARRHPRAFCRRFLGQAGWVDTRFFKVDRDCFASRLVHAYHGVTETPDDPRERRALGQAYAEALADESPVSFFPLPSVAGQSSWGPHYGDPGPKRLAKNILALAGQYRL